VSAYAFLAGHSDARRPSFGSRRRPFGVAPDVALGRLALAVLFVAVPLFNPPLWEPGQERVYLGLPLALLAVVCSIRPVLERRYGWVLLGWALAAVYAFEAGLLRGDLSPGIVGNVYRPISAVVVFCACAVLLRDADRELWIRLFLLGGLVGCGLAVLHAMVPAIDPFGPSRPNIDSLYIEHRREEGAFSYPGNLGPYAAYVAIVGLVAMERLRVRPLWPGLYTVSAAAGALAIAVSGSRAAGLALLIGVVVIGVRSPRLRVPLVGGAFVCVLAVLVLWAAGPGPVGEIVESRVDQAEGSVDIRVQSWKDSLETFRDDPLFGGGIRPDTIDGTVFYLIAVSGLVGLALVAAMYWVTLLRPFRGRDWTGLPLILGALAISIPQDVLGTPLTTWALAAGVFLLAEPKALYGERR
jgi:O-antigen ligase